MQQSKYDLLSALYFLKKKIKLGSEIKVLSRLISHILGRACVE